MIVGLFQKLQKGIEDTPLKKNLDFLGSSLYLSGQNKSFFTLANFIKLCYTPWKLQDQKPRLMKIQHDFFLIILRNSTFTLVNSGPYKSLLLEIL